MMTMNKKSAFYRCQRVGIVRSRVLLVLLVFFLLMTCVLLGVSIYLFISNNYELELLFTALFAAYAAISAVIAYVYGSGLAVRRRAFAKYGALGDRERGYIDSELMRYSEGNTVIVGERYLYVMTRSVMDFLDYSSIVWIFESLTNVSIPSGTRPENIPRNMRLSSLVIYDRDGRRYTVRLGAENDIIKTGVPSAAQYVIGTVRKKNPRALTGWSKERMHMAKRDFEKLMYEGKYV